MSQINTSSASEPDVPTSFVTDDGTAVPVANTLNLLARDTNENNDNGLRTKADPNGSDDLYVELTNRVQVGASTVGAGTSNVTLIDFSAAPFSGTAGTYTFDFIVSAFEPTTPAGGNFFVEGGCITDGTTPTIIGTPDENFDAPDLPGSNATIAVSGNELVLELTGSAGLNITWQCVGYYVRAVQ